jgi:hypothetical protein
MPGDHPIMGHPVRINEGFRKFSFAVQKTLPEELKAKAHYRQKQPVRFETLFY